MDSTVRRWPLVLIAAPAAVAIWSGWVGLGELCGFGPVRVLPGISDLTINTAVTLPVGVEAYAAYALGAWMSPGAPERAQTFAKWSAIGALIYGALGQIAFHVLAAKHAAAAPTLIVVVVSCMPVAVLGLAAGLTHLLRVPAEAETLPSATTQQAPAATPQARQQTRQPAASERAKANAKARRLLTANPGIPLADVAEKSGVSERTASRIKSGLPVPLRVAGEQS